MSTANNMKQAWVQADPLGEGFDRLGWEPEGTVFFNYVTMVDMAGYAIGAEADIDADTMRQYWGYKKPGPMGDGLGLANVDGACSLAFLSSQVVGPCANEFGQSTF
jgi:hypothetical protein